MADHRQNYGQQQQQYPTDANGPSKSQVLTIVTLLPVGGTLLLLSGLTLAGSLIGLAVTTPLFVIFSPVLVPAAIVIGLVITGFLTSGAFGIVALSTLSWMARFLRQVGAPQQMEQMVAGQSQSHGPVDEGDRPDCPG